MKLYTGDWKKDKTVQCLSLAARGLWAELVFSLHEFEPRGYLQHPNGEPFSEDEIARLVGSDPREVRSCLKELERAGTFSKTIEGVIFNRRMAHEGEVSEYRSEAGKASAKAKQERQQNLNKPSTNDQQASQQNPGNGYGCYKTKDGRNVSERSDFVEALWMRHGRKTRRQDAERVLSFLLEKAGDNWIALAEKIDNAHWAACKSEEWRKQDGKYIQALDRWLDAAPWEYAQPSTETEKPQPWRDPYADRERELREAGNVQ